MPRTLTRFVRHLDGVAEVGNRFLESGTGQRLACRNQFPNSNNNLPGFWILEWAKKA
jgi:hypothetical protein